MTELLLRARSDHHSESPFNCFPPLACGIATRWLDLDDIGAEVGKQTGTGRSRDEVSDLKNMETRQQSRRNGRTHVVTCRDRRCLNVPRGPRSLSHRGDRPRWRASSRLGAHIARRWGLNICISHPPENIRSASRRERWSGSRGVEAFATNARPRLVHGNCGADQCLWSRHKRALSRIGWWARARTTSGRCSKRPRGT